MTEPQRTVSLPHPTGANLAALRTRYEQELFERVLPFWLTHSLDRQHGGYYNCLDRTGAIYDRTKHVWLQGRQVWMLSKLYRTVEQRPEWLAAATLGGEFLRQHARSPDGRVYFALNETGQPVTMQRKMYAACFYVLAMAEYARAADKPAYLTEAQTMLAKVWHWAFYPEELGRVALPGEVPMQNLAVPMILLNLFEEVSDGNYLAYSAEIDECIQRLLRHVHRATKTVYENVGTDGPNLTGSTGRLLNPGHAIEGGWFLQHWAQRLQRTDLSATAIDMVRWSYQRGWDAQHGGILYFLDAQGHCPTQLEWNMKLWWPHCEAMYAHLLNYSLTRNLADWQSFLQVESYAFSHFSDPAYGEWYGYLDRAGNVTHTFKGGPYKGCFHVPRALWLCWRLLGQITPE
ncbi:MAG: AGE family epimerase/isomerase [Phycisphaerae bacterium]